MSGTRMKAYFACNSREQAQTLVDEGVKNILFSYAYCKKGVPEILKEARRTKKVSVMIDSGAYTNVWKPGSVVLETYCQFLKDNADHIDECIVLDDPKKREVTLRNYATMVKMGIEPHIVDHMWFDVDSPIRGVYRKGVKLCWGGMASGANFPFGDWARKLIGKKYMPGRPSYLHDPKVWEAIMKRIQERHAHAARAPTSPVHLLAVGARIRRFLPFLDVVDSFDSSSWSLGTGYGRCFMFVPSDGDAPPKIQQFDSNKPIPERYMDRIKEHKLDPKRWQDRRRICIREMMQYYAAVEVYHKKLKAQGGTALWTASLTKRDAEDESPEDLFSVREIAYNYPELLTEVVRLEQRRRELVTMTPQTLRTRSDNELLAMHDDAHALLVGGAP